MCVSKSTNNRNNIPTSIILKSLLIFSLINLTPSVSSLLFVIFTIRSLHTFQLPFAQWLVILCKCFYFYFDYCYTLLHWHILNLAGSNGELQFQFQFQYQLQSFSHFLFSLPFLFHTHTHTYTHSLTSAVRYSKMAALYTAAVAPTRPWLVVLFFKCLWILPTGNYNKPLN